MVDVRASDEIESLRVIFRESVERSVNDAFAPLYRPLNNMQRNLHGLRRGVNNLAERRGHEIASSLIRDGSHVFVNVTSARVMRVSRTI